MIVSSLLPYAAMALAPAAVSSTIGHKAAGAANERPAASLQPATAEPDEAAALQERYFEEMISSAADLLLRSMGQATRPDP